MIKKIKPEKVYKYGGSVIVMAGKNLNKERLQYGKALCSIWMG